MNKKRRHEKATSAPYQSKYIVRPELIMPEPEDVPYTTTTNAIDGIWYDVDGNHIYEE